MSHPNNLQELLFAAPHDRTAVILPEAGIQVSYQNLRDQVMTMADALAALGISPGDRVATVLPNGLPAIVSFLAASIAGTAAPLNPGYRHDEFSFFLEDTSAKILLCPPDGAADARKAAEGKVPVHSLEMDASGFVRIAGAPHGEKSPSASNDGIALVLHTSGSTGRPKRVPIRHRNIAASAHNIVAHYGLTPEDVALCAMPLFHVHGLVASTISTLAFRRYHRRTLEIQSAVLLAHGSRLPRDLVLGRSDDSSSAAGPRGRYSTRGKRRSAIHSFL